MGAWMGCQNAGLWWSEKNTNKAWATAGRCNRQRGNGPQIEYEDNSQKEKKKLEFPAVS